MNYTIEYLYEEYKNDVYAYLISLTHSKPLSEDLTSETFLCAMGSLSKYKGQSSIKTWLFGIARNKWYEHLKKKKKDITEEYLLELYASTQISIEENILRKECVRRIYEIMEELPEQQRKIFLMRVQGYSFSEISACCSISESSARVVDFRVKNKIKAILKKEGYIGEQDLV